MSGSWKFLDLLQGKFNEPFNNFEDVTFPDSNETKRLTRSKSGRYKHFKKYRQPLTANFFNEWDKPTINGSSVGQQDHGSVILSASKEEKTWGKHENCGSNVASLKTMFEVKV